jgi:hypothetical protein
MRIGRALWLGAWCIAGCHSAPPPSSTEQAQAQARPQAMAAFPPAVLTGEAKLVCNIDAKRNGVQRLALSEGGGVEFDAEVTPILDGTVHLQGPDKGGVYRFTSHLAKPAPGKLSGVGEVTVDELETKVSVTIQRYAQPGGPGTELSFRSEDMARLGIYVEFAGTAHPASGGPDERYAFRTTLGPSKKGEGRVRPSDANDNSNLVAKAVIIEAPVTTVVESVTQVRRVK